MGTLATKSAATVNAPRPRVAGDSRRECQLFGDLTGTTTPFCSE